MSHYGIRPINRSCGSYGPGHLMHWIQAKKSHEEGQPIIKVKVVAVHDDGRVEIQGDDLELMLWYHDPDHLRSALCFGGSAEWKRKYHVLMAGDNMTNLLDQAAAYAAAVAAPTK
jgi:hypothetical protein